MANNSYKKILFVASLWSLPLFVHAKGVMDFVDRSYYIVNNILIPLAFSLCLLYFFWGVTKYIANSANSSQKAGEDAKRIMIWGVVGLFVAVSVWGIVRLIRTELNIPNIVDAQRQ